MSVLAAVSAPLTPAALVAHQGGWDEILMVAAPVAIFALLLRMANRRAKQLEDSQADGAGQALAEPEPRNDRAGPL